MICSCLETACRASTTDIILPLGIYVRGAILGFTRDCLLLVAAPFTLPESSRFAGSNPGFVARDFFPEKIQRLATNISRFVSSDLDIEKV